MKSKPKSFPASSTFNEFLTQLKEEDKPTISSNNSNSENPSLDERQSIQIHTDKTEESTSEVKHNDSEKKGMNIEADNTSQETKLGTVSDQILGTQNNPSDNTLNQVDKALNDAKLDKPAYVDKQGILKVVPPTLAELTKLLINLPTAQVTRQRFSRDEMQIRLSADLSLALRNFSPYLSLMYPDSGFHVDDLVNHLVRQFILTNLESIHQMGKQLAKAETTRQLQISESLRSIERK